MTRIAVQAVRMISSTGVFCSQLQLSRSVPVCNTLTYYVPEVSCARACMSQTTS
jgi:hypothetical protein